MTDLQQLQVTYGDALLLLFASFLHLFFLFIIFSSFHFQDELAAQVSRWFHAVLAVFRRNNLRCSLKEKRKSETDMLIF